MNRLFLLGATSAALASACEISQSLHRNEFNFVNITVDDSSPYDTRGFLVFVPDEVSSGSPAILNIHGYTSSPYYVNGLAGVPEQFTGTSPTQAGPYPWVVASPIGTAPRYTTTCCKSSLSTDDCEAGLELASGLEACSWNVGGSAAGRNDVGYIRGIVDWLVEHACVDRDNMFAMGFSNGGQMSNRLFCEAAEVFRGVAPMNGNMNNGLDCQPARAISWISFCGTLDGVCNSGQEANFEKVRLLNQCTGEPHETYVTPTTSCKAYTAAANGCANGTFVETCMNEGMEHFWSGHLRPGTDIPPGFQPATNVDGTRYLMNRLSNVLA